MNIGKRLKVSAEILLGSTVIIMIIVTIKILSQGNRTGTQLLLPSIFFVMFMWLGWMQPKLTGMGLIFLGLLAILLFGTLATDPFYWRLLGTPIFIAGLLFLGAGWNFHKSK